MKWRWFFGHSVHGIVALKTDLLQQKHFCLSFTLHQVRNEDGFNDFTCGQFILQDRNGYSVLDGLFDRSLGIAKSFSS